MAPILEEALLRLGIYISSTRYLEDGASCFTKVTKYNNIDFDCEVVEDENGKEDGKEAVTNSEEKTSKKRAQHKAKKNVAQALLLAAVSGLFASAFASVFMLKSFAVVSELSAAVPRLSITVFRLSAAMPELSATVPELSALMSASVFRHRLFALIHPSAFALVFFGSSSLFVLTLSLPKIPTSNLVVRKQKLDDTISR